MRRMLFSVALLLFATLGFAQDFKLEGNKLTLPSPIYFDAGTDRLRPESEPALQHLKSYLEAKTYITMLRIESHVSNTGKETLNLQLTKKRSAAIAKWLVEQGIDCKRLIPVGFGSSKPVADNATPEGRSQNTRIEIINAALRGRAIGGMPIDGGGILLSDPCE